MTTDISLIIPVHNSYPFITECLKSAVSQIAVNLEIIIVNDFCTDASVGLIESFAQKDQRISFIHNIQRLGAGISRNLAMDKARGKYIAFMDADDFYPNCSVLSMLFKTAEKYKALICGGSLNKFDHPNSKFITQIKDQFFSQDGYMNYADYQHDGGFYRFLYLREFLNKHNLRFKDLKRYQDAEFFVRTMTVAKKFYALKSCTYVYRVNHKKIAWDYSLLKDHMTGLLSVLQLSKTHNYRILHFKVAKNFFEVLRYKMFGLYITKIRLLPLIIKLFREIDFNFMDTSVSHIRLYPAKYIRAWLFR